MMSEKEECLTYTTGAVEVRQTAHEMTIINHGPEPVKVQILTPGEPVMGHAEFTPYRDPTFREQVEQALKGGYFHQHLSKGHLRDEGSGHPAGDVGGDPGHNAAQPAE